MGRQLQIHTQVSVVSSAGTIPSAGSLTLIRPRRCLGPPESTQLGQPVSHRRRQLVVGTLTAQTGGQNTTAGGGGGRGDTRRWSCPLLPSTQGIEGFHADSWHDTGRRPLPAAPVCRPSLHPPVTVRRPPLHPPASGCHRRPLTCTVDLSAPPTSADRRRPGGPADSGGRSSG